MKASFFGSFPVLKNFLGILLFISTLLYLALCHLLSFVSFTWGSAGLDKVVQSTLPLFLAGLFLAHLLGINLLFQGWLLPRWQKRFGTVLAVAGASLLQALLWTGWLQYKEAGFSSFTLFSLYFSLEALTSASLCLFFLITRSLWALAFCHTLIHFFPCIMEEVEGPVQSLFFMVANPGFWPIRLGVSAAVLAALAGCFLYSSKRPLDAFLGSDSYRRFFVFFLLLLVPYTLTIKFVIPLAAAFKQGAGWNSFIMWDFWWVAHLALAYWLWFKEGKRAWWFALTVSGAEIAIVLTKYYLFFKHPVLNFWKINWAVNKLFVLVCFILLLELCVYKLGTKRPSPSQASSS